MVRSVAPDLVTGVMQYPTSEKGETILFRPLLYRSELEAFRRFTSPSLPFFLLQLCISSFFLFLIGSADTYVRTVTYRSSIYGGS